MSCYSVAVVLTPVQTKQIRINIHKRNSTKDTVQTIQNTVNANTRINKTPTHHKTSTYIHPHITKQVKTNTVQDIPKLNSHNIIKCPQYTVALMYVHGHFIPIKFTVTHFTSLKNKITSHKSRQFTVIFS